MQRHRRWPYRGRQLLKRGDMFGSHVQRLKAGPMRVLRIKHLVAAMVAALTVAIAASAVPAIATHAGAQPHLSVPTLTKAETQQLEHATPAEVARFDQYVNAAYGKLGIHVGVGAAGTSPKPAKVGKATLTAYQWAGGAQWDHVWVTASYADLAPFANNLGAVASAATAFCNRLPGWYGVACGAVGNIIAYFVGKFHVPNASGNHGIWGAYYWFPGPYSTGGTW